MKSAILTARDWAVIFQIWYFSNENIDKFSTLVVLSLTVVVVGVE